MSPRRWWIFAVSLWAWAIGAPIALVLLDVVYGPAGGALLACPICGSHAISCRHRAVAQVALHLAGLGGILWAWSRHGPEPAPRAANRWAVAMIQTAFMAVALIYEMKEVVTIVWSGPVIAILGCLLVAPAGTRATRVAGAASLLTALVGFYVIVLLALSPTQAEKPIFAFGFLGFVITGGATLVAIIEGFRRRSA